MKIYTKVGNYVSAHAQIIHLNSKIFLIAIIKLIYPLLHIHVIYLEFKYSFSRKKKNKTQTELQFLCKKILLFKLFKQKSNEKKKREKCFAYYYEYSKKTIDFFQKSIRVEYLNFSSICIHLNNADTFVF